MYVCIYLCIHTQFTRNTVELAEVSLVKLVHEERVAFYVNWYCAELKIAE